MLRQTCRSYGARRKERWYVFCYTHVAPLELKPGISARFQPRGVRLPGPCGIPALLRIPGRPGEPRYPKQQADPGYLPGKGFRVYAGWGKDAPELDPGDIDWSSYTAENFPYRLIQDPGEVNSLGRIKFMLPNPYAVYLHDTPSRHLFANDMRALSHGCIRTERALERGGQAATGGQAQRVAGGVVQGHGAQ